MRLESGRRLDHTLDNDSELQAFAGELGLLFTQIQQSNWEALVVAEPGSAEAVAKDACTQWNALPLTAAAALEPFGGGAPALVEPGPLFGVGADQVRP